MNENKNVPELRFPGFEGEWEVKKLGSLTSKIGSGSTPSGGEAVYTTDGILFIRSQNVNNNRLDLTDKTFIPSFIHEKMKGSAVIKGDVLLNITGASIGRSCIVPECVDEANVNQHVCIIRPKNQVDKKYLQAFLSSHKGQKLIYQGQTGSGREGLNFQSIASFKIHFPALPEQQKIADFLSAVDKKIQQLTEKHRLLTEYKKGVMQQIFSQQIRFKDDEGNEYPEWEFLKLKKIATFFSGGTPTSSKKSFYVGNIPFIKSGEINSEQTEQFISEEALKNSSAKIVEKGDILFALYGATSGEVAISKLSGAINQAVLCIRSEQVKAYIFSWLKFNKESILSTYLQGGQGNLSAQIVKELQMPLPSFDEQQKIANFLTAIDNKIDQARLNLEQTKALKKGLLQKMFV